MTEIDLFLSEYLDYNKRIRELEKKKENVRSNILIFLKTKNLASYQDESGNCKATISTTKRKKLNQEKVKDLLGESYDSCIEEHETEMLRVTSNFERNLL